MAQILPGRNDLETLSGRAIISECGHYRYRLERDLCPGKAKVIAFIMVNPSTADAEQDDPTIRRCIGFAKRFGARRMIVGNLFAYRATDVRELAKITISAAIGPNNQEQLGWVLREADLAIAAWGPTSKLPPNMRHRWQDAARLANRAGTVLHCLGTAKDGHPRHPLMLRADAPLSVWKTPWFPEMAIHKPQKIVDGNCE